MPSETAALETQRLRLRRFTADDAPLMLEIWNSPEFLRYVGDRGIRTITDAESVLCKTTLADYDRYGYGAFHVSLKSGDPVGICGLFHRPELEHPDLGFAILPSHYGRGYAREAAVAVLDYCDNVLALEVVDGIVAANNRASIGLLEQLGMRFEIMICVDDNEEVRLYRRYRDAQRQAVD